MPASISLLDNDVFTALRSFLLLLLPSVEVVQAQDNGVPMPLNGFITMNNVSKTRLATNTDTYTDPGSNPGSKNMLTPTQFVMQLDFYGPSAGDWAAIVQAAFRDGYACDNMPANIQPLYADNPIQLPLISGEEQFLQRWKCQAAMQYNPITTVPQDFWTVAQPVTLVDVDTEYT